MNFLDDIMSQIGFGLKWRSWIKGCLNSACGSVLVNGSPTLEFKIKREGFVKETLCHDFFSYWQQKLNVAILEVIDKYRF